MDASCSRGRSSNADVDASISKNRVRDLSALGNRHYAAPEILRGVRERHSRGRSSRRSSDEHSKHKNKDKVQIENESKCVSDYSMVADAFSVGATIRYMLTGVPPGINVEEFMAMQSSPLAVMARLVGKVLKKTSKKKNKQQNKIKKRYKRGDELPKNAAILVRALTHWDPTKRLTVRAARSYPW
eukprot:13995057-Ditylum_brightwellii.AAC.1